MRLSETERCLVNKATAMAYRRATERGHINIEPRVAGEFCIGLTRDYSGPTDYWIIYLYFLGRLLEFDDFLKKYGNDAPAPA